MTLRLGQGGKTNGNPGDKIPPRRLRKEPIWFNLARSFTASLWQPIERSRRSVRVAEGARLESVYTLTAYRGFESLLLRQTIKKATRQGGLFYCLAKSR